MEVEYIPSNVNVISYYREYDKLRIYYSKFPKIKKKSLKKFLNYIDNLKSIQLNYKNREFVKYAYLNYNLDKREFSVSSLDKYVVVFNEQNTLHPASLTIEAFGKRNLIYDLMTLNDIIDCIFNTFDALGSYISHVLDNIKVFENKLRYYLGTSYMEIPGTGVLIYNDIKEITEELIEEINRKANEAKLIEKIKVVDYGDFKEPVIKPVWNTNGYITGYEYISLYPSFKDAGLGNIEHYPDMAEFITAIIDANLIDEAEKENALKLKERIDRIIKEKEKIEKIIKSVLSTNNPNQTSGISSHDSIQYQIPL